MKYLTFIFLLTILVSCGETGQHTESAQNNDTSSVREQKTATVSDPFEGCYRSVTGRDTLTIHLVHEGENYSGMMHFDNFEKDGSRGPVKGQVQNGKLHLWYSFESEGMHSVMEVVLKHESKGLVRAMGPITNRGDTAVFQNPGALEFPQQDPLKKLDCSELKEEDR